MRNLTLGVLIVTGGTLAALPFRRYHVIPDASVGPLEATGPTQSALDLPPMGSLAGVQIDRSSDVLPLPDSLPIWRSDARPASTARRLDVPLSFDDLMVPLDEPEPIRRRFTATTDVRASMSERQNAVALEMPPIDALRPSLQQELSRKIASTPTPELPPRAREGAAVTGSLASSPWQTAPADRLPKQTAPIEERQWIRQP